MPFLKGSPRPAIDDAPATNNPPEAIDDARSFCSAPGGLEPDARQSIPLGMFGFGILMGWHFLILYFPELSVDTFPDASVRFVGQLVLNGSVFLSFAFFGWLVGKLEKRAQGLAEEQTQGQLRKICVAGIVVAVAAVLVFGFVNPYTLPLLYHASIGVMGICEGLFMLLWFRLYADSSANHTISYLAASAMIGAVICFFTRHLTGYLPLVVFIALPVFSMSLLFVSVRHTRHRDAGLHEKGKPDWEGASGFFYKTTAQLVAFSFCFGLLQGMATLGDSVPFHVENSLSTLGFGAAGAILYLVHLRSPEHQNLKPAHLVSVMLFLLGVSFVSFVAGAPAVVMSALVMTGFTLFDMVTLCFLLNLTRSFDLNAEKTLGYNRAAEYAAFTIGIALSFAVTHLFGDYPLLGNLVTAAASFICGGTVLLLFMDTDNIWAQDAAPAPGPSGTEDETAAETKGRWKTACEQICDEFRLSSRERDVFALIAKGRNAEYVQNALFISGHTAKTHISNIYKKLEIHSVQELLDLIEDRKERLV